jgi:hypothetical protein
MSVIQQLLTSPPGYPARPINGGPLAHALPKAGHWVYEPKVNGWRAWVHVPTGAMFNRRNEPMSIANEFKPVLSKLRDWHEGLSDGGFKHGNARWEWLDTEAFERRHPLGRGSLIILDAPLCPGPYWGRQNFIHTALVESGVATNWAHEQFAPPTDSLLSFAYIYEDEANQGRGGAKVIDPALYPEAAWKRLQAVNKVHGCELFEGLVAKRIDSPYPLQKLSADREFSGWMKHRWAF